MGSLFERITDWIKEGLIDAITGQYTSIFNSVNNQVADVANQVGQTPQGWNGGVFSMIQNLSETVVIPIAGMILTFVLVYELIQMILEKNNMHEFDTFNIFKWIFKTFVATYLLTNCFTIVMAVFDVAQNVVSQSAGVINGNLDVQAALSDLETQLEAMGMWELIGLWLETNIINLCMWVLSIVIFVIVYGRMIEIYLTVSLAPIPFSTMANREWGQMGTGYLRSLFALGFQGFLILICVAIYAVLVQSITLKSDFILSLCDLIIGGKEGLSPIERTIIDRCTRLVYREYLQDPCPENMPILGDLYELLLKQSEPEAQNIATALEIYVNGSLNVFNHRSNIQMDQHRVLCFQLKSLGKALKEIGLLIMQDAVWNRVTANRSKHKTTWFYIDEFHLLLKGQTGSFSVEIWKRFRKWGGIPSGLTQNVKDLLASREIENIFENSDFIYMLNQAQGDRQILAKQLGISPHQLSYVTHSGPGEGLLFFGNVIIPFVDHFPKDTLLYSVLTTRPDEIAGTKA